MRAQADASDQHKTSVFWFLKRLILACPRDVMIIKSIFIIKNKK